MCLAIAMHDSNDETVAAQVTSNFIQTLRVRENLLYVIAFLQT